MMLHKEEEEEEDVRAVHSHKTAKYYYKAKISGFSGENMCVWQTRLTKMMETTTKAKTKKVMNPVHII